jgi:hypothetical protein
MSLLTPLYIAGLLALSVPLLLHLIRRTPRGRQAFSSLMFLSPSPPRLTRRSRLEHLLLLFLRIAALVLLALAFARPFLRKMEQLDLGAGGTRRTAIVLDTSASMRRDGAWQKAIAKAEAVIERAAPEDGVALLTFAEAPVWLATFEEVAETPPGRRRALLAGRLAQARPTWGAADLGAALIAAADSLDSLDAKRPGDKPSDAHLEIVVVSDLAEGTRLAALEAYDWPKRVRVAVDRVEALSQGNAGVHLAAKSEADLASQAPRGKAKEIVRVRVTSSADSHQEQFAIHWASSRAVAKSPAAQLHVPAGESRVIKLARPSNKSFDSVVLRGDRNDFDNRVYLPRAGAAPGKTYFLGDDAPDDASGLLYYLLRAIDDDSDQSRTVEINPPSLPAPKAGESSPPFLVIGSKLSPERLEEASRFLSAGGAALLAAGDVETAAMLPQLVGAAGEFAGSIDEAQLDDFALLGEIDFGDPLFAPFADPRFGDFTGIHFWRHRRIDAKAIPENASPRVLARFENGDAALVECRPGSGRLWVLATSWRPKDSELARSSKFVPLLWGMLTAGESEDVRRTAFRVNESVPLAGEAVVRTPGGEAKHLAPDARRFSETTAPGVYRIFGPQGNREFAVNLAAEESRTAPLPIEQLESRGVQITGEELEAKLAAQKRQLLDMELEGRQQLWRWLLVAALLVLLIETVLAGRAARLGRKSSASREAAPEGA